MTEAQMKKIVEALVGVIPEDVGVLILMKKGAVGVNAAGGPLSEIEDLFNEGVPGLKQSLIQSLMRGEQGDEALRRRQAHE